MIGKSLRERFALGALAEDKAVAVLKEALKTHSEDLVQIRLQDARMIAFLVIGADKLAVQFCRELGFEMKLGGTAAFGIMGLDASKLFNELPQHQRAWLESPCAARETKVFLIAGGTALLSLETSGGKVTITAATAPSPHELN